MLGDPCPGSWHRRGWVCAEGTELRASGDKKLSGGGRRREGGRESGAITFLSPIGVGWEAPGRLPKPPGVRGGAAKGPSEETLQSRGWRPGMDRAVPPRPPAPRSPRAPQPKPPPSTIRSHSLRRPRASCYCFFSGSEGRTLGSASRVRALSRGRSGAGEAAGARGPSRGLSEGAVPPAPRRVLCTPARRFAATSAACRFLSSSIRSLSSKGFPRPVPGAGGQRDERLGRSESRVPCLRSEVLRESPSDPRRGAYAGWGAKLGERAEVCG